MTVSRGITSNGYLPNNSNNNNNNNDAPHKPSKYNYKIDVEPEQPIILEQAKKAVKEPSSRFGSITTLNESAYNKPNGRIYSIRTIIFHVINSPNTIKESPLPKQQTMLTKKR